MTAHSRTGSLFEAFVVARGWLDGGTDAPPRTEADAIAQAFGLDTFGRNLLLLCAYTVLEPDAQDALAELLGVSVAVPTVGLALARVPGAHWQALAADAPLRRAQIVTLEGSGGLIGQRIHLAESALMRLLGAPALGPEAATCLRPVPVPERLAPNRARLSGEIAQRIGISAATVLHLCGPDPEGKLQAFGKAAGAVWALNSAALPQGTTEIAALARLLARDMVLSGAHLALVHEAQGDDRAAQLFVDAYPAPLAIVSAEPLRAGLRRAMRLEMQPPTAAEQQPVWELALAPFGESMTQVMPQLASTFRVSPEMAGIVADEVAAAERQTRQGNGSDKLSAPENAGLAHAAWKACRRAARPRMDDLAQRIDSSAGWDDLILPARQKDTLWSIAAQVRNRAQVYESWGFAERLQNKGLGVSALFSGPSGAGKSMAGEVLAQALELDLYRVDLSALVSKWVGETEKNLRRVFDAAEDGGVILQFDEADALFGKRSEVKDSQDRNANIEVSYLLQRLEAYRGLCILTTNMRDNIDEAFMRRIRFVVSFRFPAPGERRAIWQRIFPSDVPCDGLDVDALAQLALAGGSIRNVALSAAFLAADRGQPLTMALLAEAARQEYEKLGRALTAAELAGWPL